MSEFDQTATTASEQDAPSSGHAPEEEAAARPEAHAPVQEQPSQTQSNGAAEIESDLDELVKVANQRDEYLALAQRTQADFENYRKRVAREASAAQERGVATLAKELLPALDNLDRAIEAAQEDDPLLKGVSLVRAEIAGALNRAGIEAFCPLGESFDPSLHEAVATAPHPEGGASGMVIEVYQDGYRQGESVLRPARVVVAA